MSPYFPYFPCPPISRIDADGHFNGCSNHTPNDLCDGSTVFPDEQGDQEEAAATVARTQELDEELGSDQQQVSQAGQDFIKGYETLSLTVYDASKGKKKGGDWTIGWGHKTTKDASPITGPEAEALFQKDVARMASHVAGDLDVPVTQQQFDALVSLRFNAGANAITPPVADLNRTGHATMGDFTKHYITQSGVLMGGLVKRRAAEWRIFSEGVYDASH